MKRQWQSGDVAMVTGPRHFLFPFSDDTTTALCRRDNDCWYAIGHGNGVGWTDREVKCVEPTSLVVIDPEDREQLDALTKALIEACYAHGNVICADNGIHPDTMQAALREFANPTPPKPDEPTGLGAVVFAACECSPDPRRFVRDDTGSDYPSPWKANCGHHAWAELSVRDREDVLSEGVRDEL